MDPLAGLTPELRALATSKRAAEERAARGEDLPLEELILTLPTFDPRVQAGDCVFDVAAARRAIGFFTDLLTHIEGEWAGKPFVLSPWQKAIVANLLGWKRPDGLRRFREMFLEVPRKNGKTPLAAGIVLLLLCMDGEPGAQIYSAAGDRDQAALIYRQAEGMVANEPVLSACVLRRVSGKCLEYPRNGSFYRALSAESRTKHGLNCHGVVVDELHVQKDSRLVDVLTSSTGTRRQPLIIFITTADWARPSLCNEKEAYAEKVAANLINDPEYLPVIYRASKSEPWDQEATWKKANPNYGVSIKPDEMKREARLASFNPRVRNTFLRLRLNLKTNAETLWIPSELWQACGEPPILHADVDAWIDKLGLEGMKCYAGLDLSSTRDLTAFVLFFPEVGAILPYFWAPALRAEEREELEGVSYTAWASDGWLKLCKASGGRSIDYGLVRKEIGELGQRFRIQEIDFDRWGSAKIAKELEDDGFDVVEFGQGYASMSPASKAFEKLWLDGKLQHGGHPVLAWNASNTMVQTDDADNIKPTKKKSTDRIDGIVATIMAVGGAAAAEGDDVFTDGFKRL